MLKIYVQDQGWAGMLVVIAKNEQEARDLMSKAFTYAKDCSVQEYEMTNGLAIFNYGDS